MNVEATEHGGRVRTYFDARVGDYDGFYEPASWAARTFNRVFRKAVYLRRDMVAELAARYACKTVLDVGCGSGRNSVWFVRHGVEQVHGIDFSGEMIEQAKQLAADAGVPERCRFDTADFLAMPEGPRYDLVAALGVFDYVESPEPFLRHMSRFADRVIYASFPGWTLVRSPLRKVRYALRGCPTRFYRQRDLVQLFDAIGFGRMETRHVPSGRLAWAAKESAES